MPPSTVYKARESTLVLLAKPLTRSIRVRSVRRPLRSIWCRRAWRPKRQIS